MFVWTRKHLFDAERKKNTSPIRTMMYPISCCSFFFTYCLSEIKTKCGLAVTELDFKASIQSHVRVKEGKHAESQRPDRKGIEVVTLTYAAYTIKTQTGVHTITFLITQMLSWLVFYFISMQSETSVK